MTNLYGFIFQFIQLIMTLVLSPLLLGWINQCRYWLQNRQGPGVFQPYRQLVKLFCKDAVLADNASPLFRMTPYFLFACMCLAGTIVPVLATNLPFASVADVIVLVGIFALARVFLALAAMDIGTAFGNLGARREMMIGFLAEPALLMVLFTPAFISHSTALTTIVDTLSHTRFIIYPSMAFAMASYLMVLLAENSRIPVDNPSTHLELTMIHEAMLLEYSARHLALVEWASSIKLYDYFVIGFALFVPWGIASGNHLSSMLLAFLALFIKLAFAGFGLAIVETLSAKMRIFRVPEFLGTAFMLAVLGTLTHFLLEA